MAILFILTYILLIYSFIRIKKTNNKLNILIWILISIITYMGYNSILIYLLSILGIHSTLLLRSIIHIIISIIFIIISKKNKQQYYFNKMDLGVIIVLFYLSIIIFIVRFGFNFNLDFEMNDGAVHFAMAKSFMTSHIYDSTMTNIIYKISNKGLFFSSTNAGTFLEILKPITKDIGLYKGFIIFEMLSFFLSGTLLYFIIRKNKYTNRNYILTIIFLIIYQLGYPLLNLLYGFHYWGLTILIISSIIITVKEMTNNKLYKNIIILIMLFIQTYSIFIAYYLYIPVIYGSLGLYFLYLWRVKKELTIKRSITYIIIILFIPFCFGIIYYNILGEYFTNFSTKTNIQIDGDNYKNLLGNFIYLIPILFYGIINEIKSKKINLVTIITIMCIIYTIILFILCINNTMSNYYFNKIYNLLWLINFIYLINIDNNKDLFIKTYLYSYIIIIILSCFRVETTIDKYKHDISNNTVISNIGNIYDTNINIIQNRKGLIDNDTLELLKQVKKHEKEYKNKYGKIPFIANYHKKIWITQILDIIISNDYILDASKRIVDTMWVNNIKEIENDDDVTYFVWLPDEENSKGINIEDYSIIYSNNKGYILKK